MARRKSSEKITLSAIKMFKEDGTIRIPVVQRDLVWTKSQKQLLVDSLMKDYDIPKIYFRVVEENGREYFDVIDGQQRLNAIYEYMTDQFAMPLDADDLGDEVIANKLWSQLSLKFQTKLSSRSLDVVQLYDYTDAETDETFLRLQNGTPLKAAEKRRAIAGEMRNVIKQLSTSDVFERCCGFNNDHYAHEDVTAKILKQITEGSSSAISANALQKFYENNKNISIEQDGPKKVKKAYSFIKKAFATLQNPRLKRYALMDLSVIASSMLTTYDLGSYPKEFGQAYLDFVEDRELNAEKDEEQQDPKFISYSNAARADSLEFIEFRQNFLRDYIIEKMPYLETKDGVRNFTPEQRFVIFRRSGGKCAECGTEISEDDFEADHIFPWSRGGRTKVANGQALCRGCNRSKSNSVASSN